MGSGSMKRMHALRLLFVAATVAALPACDDASGLEEHNEVAEVSLTVGSQTVLITEGGATGSLSVSAGTHAVTIVTLDADGDQVGLESGSSIEISTSNQAVARYTSLTATTGTLVTAKGSTQLTLSIMHGGHADFQQTVAITVN